MDEDKAGRAWVGRRVEIERRARARRVGDVERARMGFAVGGRRRVARLDQRGAVGDRRVVVIGRIASRLVERRPDLLRRGRLGGEAHAATACGRMGKSASKRRPARRQKAGRSSRFGDHLGVFVVTQEEAPALVMEHCDVRLEP